MGDTNLDMNNVKSLCDICVVYDMTNLVDGATCFTCDKPSIDVLLSTEPNMWKVHWILHVPSVIFTIWPVLRQKFIGLTWLRKTIYYHSYKKLLKGNKQASEFSVSVRGQGTEFSKSITALGICIDENITFDEHVNNICLIAGSVTER